MCVVTPTVSIFAQKLFTKNNYSIVARILKQVMAVKTKLQKFTPFQNTRYVLAFAILFQNIWF